MSGPSLPGVPPVSVDCWEGRPLGERAFQETLALLAHRAMKPVRVSRYAGGFHFSEKVLRVYAPRPREAPDPGSLGVPVLRDGSGQPLAAVHANCLLVLAPLNPPGAQENLARAAHAALPHLDFNLPPSAKEKDKALAASIKACAARFAEKNLNGKRDALRRAHAEVESAAARLAEAAAQVPARRAEIKAAEDLAERLPETAARREIRRLKSLMDNGLYERVDMLGDAAVEAETCDIAIRHNGHVFPMGRYSVFLSPDCRPLIESLDGHAGTEHPHPHVAPDGRPCLGSAAGPVGRLLARFRIAEALALLHEFLCSYSRDSAFERIGSFDPTGEYEDDDGEECEDCDDRRSPYCIARCSVNGGQFEPADCDDFRTEYCYAECAYNGDGCPLMKPCDFCSPEGGKRQCLLGCAYNRHWELHDPCEECKRDGCKGCPYAGKAESLGRELRTPSTPGEGEAEGESARRGEPARAQG